MNLPHSTQKYQRCFLIFGSVTQLRVVFIYADVNRMLADILNSISSIIKRLVSSVVSNSSVINLHTGIIQPSEI